LDRNVRWDVSIGDGHLYVTTGGKSFDAALHPRSLLEDGATEGA
jgi:hypothetical protein